MPDLSDLPESAKQAILKISEMGNPGVCSRCRWTCGCLSCSVEKAEKYASQCSETQPGIGQALSGPHFLLVLHVFSVVADWEACFCCNSE